MKNILIIVATVLALCSCNNGDYVDAIPGTATALVAIDGFSPLLSDIENLDTTKTTYLFELPGGEMGLCAMDTDGDPLIKFLDGDDNARIEKLQRHMEKCEPENSIRHSQLWKHLREVKGKMRMVAQTNVLPKQMQACLMLGAPKGTDPADVLLEAGLSYDNITNNKGTLTLTGHTCAYDTMREQMLKQAFKCFKPVSFDWQKLMDNSDDALIGIFMNVDGKDFVPLLQQNKALNIMLMGTNAIDRIRENHGNIAVLGSIDNKWTVNSNLSPLTSNPSKLILCLNMQSLPKELEQAIGFLTKKINRIVYKVE